MALAANSGRKYILGLESESLKGAISLYGMHDLSLPTQREHPFTEFYIGASYDVEPASHVEASTVAHADPADPPILILHGSIDGSVSVKNSDRLAEVLESMEIPYTYDRIEGWPHLMDFFSPLGERSLWQIHRFLMNHMPSDEIREATMH
jgi:predicted esterase